jgi:hypothetical protein
MMKTLPLLLLAVALGAPSAVLAGPRGDAILGGALGGALGAAIGSELGGRDGAIIGSAIGGATGTALTTQRYQRPHSEVFYVDRPGYHAPRDYGPPSHYRGPPPSYRGHYRGPPPSYRSHYRGPPPSYRGHYRGPPQAYRGHHNYDRYYYR